MALRPEIAGHLNLDGPAVTPRPSATVLLLRGTNPWELLLVHRPGGADFAPGAYVFPGGAVHDEDREWDDEIGAAAVRETFEETGILLARKDRRFAGDADCSALRSAIASGASFARAATTLGLVPAFDRLVTLARWVTPAQVRRRFDTRFYLARLPTGQTVHPQEGEVTDWLWITPQRALDSAELTLVYATRAVLESVADQPDVRKLFTRARRLRDIPVVEPRIVKADSGWTIER
jgi:8-oxo-dGTP pyrophosphatase MutT (NUDIX family)